jgi:hypothetical protein
MQREIFSEYHFKEDGTYEMKGYPTVAEQGAVEVCCSSYPCINSFPGQLRLFLHCQNRSASSFFLDHQIDLQIRSKIGSDLK